MNLAELNLNNNQIIDISHLSGLTNLEDLNLGNNQISDTGVSYLSGLTNLTDLHLGNNQISDITAIDSLTNLDFLHLATNQISDISALSSLTNLKTLYLYSNQINDIYALSGHTNLTLLWLRYNQISDISALSSSTNLRTLYIQFNQISDISALSGLTNLNNLLLHSNQISDISALSGLTNLKTLRLDSNQISKISALVSNLGLGSGDEIWLEDNPLEGQAIYYDIPIVEGRGATVYYDVPAWVDTDGDSIPDLWEEIYDEPSEVTDTGILPLDPAVDDADNDNDGDGKSNLEEHNANTDPTSAADVFMAYNINCVTGSSSDTVTVQWYTKPGMDYQLYGTDSLETQTWTPVPGTYTDHGDTASQVDVITPPGTKRYYKVEVW